MSIAVVIPFYQQERGLLRRALLSVAAQAGVGRMKVVIVDDASPIRATEELVDLPETTRHLDIEVLHQANGGPARARNKALDALDASITRVAFLDSDDQWRPHHLADALTALDAGHEAYFSDFRWATQTVGAFARGGRIDVGEHPRIGDGAAIHSYRGDMFDQIISGNVIGTSTVVYAFDRHRGLRFDAAHFHAGEDYLFWIGLARAGARFAFSSQISVDCGYGVNVYAGSGWGTEGFLHRVHDEIRYRKKLLAFPLSPSQRKLVKERIRALRREFAMGTMLDLLRRRPLNIRMLRSQWRLDPLSIFAIPIEAGNVAASRIRKKRAERGVRRV